MLDVGRWLDPPRVSWASPTCMAGGGVDHRGWRSWFVRPPPSSRVHVMQLADGPMTLKMMCAPTAPCTAVLAGGAHDVPEARHVMLTRGQIRALPLRGRGEGGNWTHERKSENLMNECAFRKTTNPFLVHDERCTNVIGARLQGRTKHDRRV
jgi:hypothetical protein